MSINGKTIVAAVIGYPVRHSRSPFLHGYWLEKYGINGTLIPLEISPNDISIVLPLLPKLGLVGASVTLPFKETAFSLAEHTDEAAEAIGAVNMLSMSRDGGLSGRNTDGYGYIENLRQCHPGWQPSQGPAMVLGAGGAARAVVYALALAGTPEICLVNRTQDKAEKIVKDLSSKVDSNLVVGNWSDREAQLKTIALLVNSTSLGMSGKPELPINLEQLSRTALVSDIVYSPLMTPLLKNARERGNPIVDGLGMLIHQARPAFREWFGIDPEVTQNLREKLVKDLKDRSD